MLTVEIIAVGKIKEGYLKEAVCEYSKRLSRFCSLKITEVQDFADSPISPAREAEQILPKLKGFCVALCIEGKQLDSEGFAGLISEKAVEGVSHITFLIGGSNGLDEKVKEKANLRLSFSEMTFPHQLMRVILLEQIYRGFKIINNENYHK